MSCGLGQYFGKLLAEQICRLIEAEARLDYRGWMSPSGRVTMVPPGIEHENHPPASGLPKDLKAIQANGHVRVGHTPNSIHGGDVHYIHYDASHPKGHATALKALNYLKPHHDDTVLLVGRPGHSGFVTPSERKSSEAMGESDAKEMKPSEARQHLRSKANAFRYDNMFGG